MIKKKRSAGKPLKKIIRFEIEDGDIPMGYRE